MCVIAQGRGITWSFWRWNGFHAVLSAEPMEIRATLISLSESLRRDAGDEAVDRVELVLAEVLNNIAEHGGAKGRAGGTRPQIRIAIRRGRDGMCCVVMDNGIRFPGNCFARRDLPPVGAELPEGGFGLCLMRSIACGIRYRRLLCRNLLVLFVPGSPLPRT